MDELEVKERTLKLHVFDEFRYEDLKEVLDAIVELGYSCTAISNGNYILVKKEAEVKKE